MLEFYFQYFTNVEARVTKLCNAKKIKHPKFSQIFRVILAEIFGVGYRPFSSIIKIFSSKKFRLYWKHMPFFSVGESTSYPTILMILTASDYIKTG